MSSKVNDDNNDLPLLDEVNELIEKERILFQLKLIEKENETNKWKEKYQNTINLLNNNSNQSNDLIIDDNIDPQYNNNIVEHLDNDIQYKENENKVEYIDKQMLMYKLSLNNHVIDLSNMTLNDSNDVLHQINKLMISKDPDISIRLINLHNCLLNDENSDRLMDILSHSSLQAIDLSFNELGPPFLTSLCNILKNHRQTLQYILLDGNSLANSDKIDKSTRNQLINSLLDSLTDSTWGISLTLHDFDIMKGLVNVKETNNKSLYDSPSSLMLNHSFLSQLNNLLDPINDIKSKMKITKKTSTKTKSTGKYRGGLQLLSCLSLTNTQLSKLSIKELQRTIYLTASTLSDLDLSFAYVGYLGSTMLRDFILSKDCRLVRLGLKGNAIGNEGILEISNGLKYNQSLTYLDIQSNNITNIGITNSLTNLSNNIILYKINLIGNNDITHDCRISTERVLNEIGSPIVILWSRYMNDRQLDDRRLYIPSEGIQLIEVNHKLVKSISPLAETLIYEIDLKRLNVHYESHKLDQIGISWLWKPSSYRTSTIQSNKPKKPLHWYYEIRIVNNKGKVVSTTSYNDKKIFCHMNNYTHDFDWIHGSIVLSKDLPIDGYINLYIHSVGTRSVYETHLSTRNLRVYTIPTDSYILSNESDEDNSYECLSVYLLPTQLPIPDNYEILRAIRWLDCYNPSGLLSFESQLNQSINNNISIFSISYVIKIYVYRSDSCILDELLTITSDNSPDASDGIPSSWRWTKQEVSFDSIHNNDIIIITSSNVNTENDTSVDSCYLSIKNLQIKVIFKSRDDEIDKYNSNIAFNSGVYCIFNHNNLQLY